MEVVIVDTPDQGASLVARRNRRARVRYPLAGTRPGHRQLTGARLSRAGAPARRGPTRPLRGLGLPARRVPGAGARPPGRLSPGHRGAGRGAAGDGQRRRCTASTGQPPTRPSPAPPTRPGSRAAGGVDLQLLGIGTDGHIGFNEPGSSLASRTRIKTLTDQTRHDNARFFDGDVEAVPRHVLTQGVGTILQARPSRARRLGRGEGARRGRHLRGADHGLRARECAAAGTPTRRSVIDRPAAAQLHRRAYDEAMFALKPAWQGPVANRPVRVVHDPPADHRRTRRPALVEHDEVGGGAGDQPPADPILAKHPGPESRSPTPARYVRGRDAGRDQRRHPARSIVSTLPASVSGAWASTALPPETITASSPSRCSPSARPVAAIASVMGHHSPRRGGDSEMQQPRGGRARRRR